MAVKRIGTLTFHVAHNYGAMLQAYALPVALQSLGYDCEVIDYCFPYIYQWGINEGINELVLQHGYIGGSLRWIKRLLKGQYSAKKKINKFNDFRKNIIPHSTQAYMSKNELCNLDYDAIVFGSDQIWNDKLTDGVAEEFFGGFKVLPKTKKIAYAASNGCDSFDEKIKKICYPMLKEFAGLGIREKGLTESLVKDGFSAINVIDPTLLLKADSWNSMLEKAKQKMKLPKEKYLLIYAFDEDEAIYEVAKDLAEKNNLKIVVISYQYKEALREFMVYTECGPVDFVNLIANAQMVLTTSFHGTAFSIIYHKDFYCVPHPQYHERTDSLLNLLELQERNLTSLKKAENPQSVNWDNVEMILKKEREKAYSFFKTILD